MAATESRIDLDGVERAIAVLDDAVGQAARFIGANINWKITEHDLSEFIYGKLYLAGYETQTKPQAAFNANSCERDYVVNRDAAAVIRREGWLTLTVGVQTKPAGDNRRAVNVELAWSCKIGAPPSAAQSGAFAFAQSVCDAAQTELARLRGASAAPIAGWELHRAVMNAAPQTEWNADLEPVLGWNLNGDERARVAPKSDARANAPLAPDALIKIEPVVIRDERAIKCARLLTTLPSGEARAFQSAIGEIIHAPTAPGQVDQAL